MNKYFPSRRVSVTRSFSKLVTRFALVLTIASAFMFVTAAGTNAAGFSFLDSVKDFFGIQTPVSSAMHTADDLAPLAAFTPGNLVMYRVDGGGVALTSNASAVFLDEYTPAGALVQSIAMPTAVSGLNKRLTASGTATSEGFMTRSVDGRYLIAPGYDAALGTASITGSASTAINRVIGRVDSGGAVDTTTALTDAITGGNPRGATSTNGTDLWLAGSTGGMRYATLGATTSTSLAAAPTNLRVPAIFGGQLFVSSNTTTFHLSTVGTGTPTTGSQTIANLPGFPVTGSHYSYYFADLNAGVAGVDTLYVAEDTANQIQKYSLVAGNWTANGTVALTAARGLTGITNGNNVTLYVTNRTTFQTLTDTSGYNATISGTLTSLVTASPNTALQGIAFAPEIVTVNPASLPNGTVGSTYPNPVSASGGVAPYAFAITSGTPPTGLSLNTNGIWSGTATVAGPFSFTVTATDATGITSSRPYTVTIDPAASAPEIDVQGNANSIIDGDITPAAADDTDFGSTSVTGGTVSHTFTILNTGSGALNLSPAPAKVVVSGVNAADFIVSVQPTSPVAALTGSTTFTVVFDPTAIGLRTATLSIANDDADENPYDFSIQGTGTGTPAINVSPISQSYNVQALTTTSATQNVTISNTGTGDLHIGTLSLTGANPGDFVISNNPSGATITPGNNLIFQMAFAPTATGPRSAAVNIPSDDPVNPTKTVSLNGTGVNIDYTVTTTGNAIVVTDVAGNGDSLTMSEPVLGAVRFGASGRNFVIDGSLTLTGGSGNILLAGKNSITVNEGTGNDGFFVAGFAGQLPSLTVNGGVGNDLVQFNGAVTFAPNANLDIDMQNDDPTPGSDRVDFITAGPNSGQVTLSGTGAVTIKVSQAITFLPATFIHVVDGNILFEINQQAVPMAGTSPGLFQNGGSLVTSGTGNISILSKGQNGAGGNHFGLAIVGGAGISSTSSAAGAGTITLNGRGGTGSSGNGGVDLENLGTLVTSVRGDISITGQGAVGTGTLNVGVHIQTGAAVTSTGPAKITIDGTGGTGTSSSTGVRILSDDTKVTSSGGDMTITGHGGGGTTANHHGVSIANGALIGATGGAKITVNGTGGTSGTSSNTGVLIFGAGSQPVPVPTTISSDSGDISITGLGGTTPGIANIGINTISAAKIVATGAANITLTGTGTAGSSDCYGVGFEAGAIGGNAISAVNGNVLITGTGGPSAGIDMDGVRFEDSSGTPALPITMSTTGTGLVTLNGTAGNNDPTSSGINLVNYAGISSTGAFTAFIADTMDLGNNNVSVNVGANTLTLVGKTAGRPINIGGGDSAVALGLTDAEVDVITAGILYIGDTNGGPVTFGTALTRPSSTNLHVVSASTIAISGGVVDTAVGDATFDPGATLTAAHTGTDVNTGILDNNTFTLASGKTLSLAINGTAPDISHDQLNVTGKIDISGANLNLTGGYVPTGGEIFVIINNDGNFDAITGTFAGKPEGFVFTNFLGSGLNAVLSYVGGDGNDAVITVASAGFTLSTSVAGSGTGTITSNPAGINCGADCSEVYTGGTSVDLTATPTGGSTFAGWSGACSGLVQPCTVSMTVNRSVTATFNAPSGATVIQFASPAYIEDESQTASINLHRTGDLSAPSTVKFSTVAGGTATGGAVCSPTSVDYITVTDAIVTFAIGQADKSASVVICGGDLMVEAGDNIDLLVTPDTNGTIGAQNTAVLNINDTASVYRDTSNITLTTGSGATPYGSPITVTGGPTLIGSMRVTLYDVSHVMPANMDVLLEGPGGRKYLMMADTGGVVPVDPSAPVTLSFTDTSSTLVSNTSWATGTFLPTTWEPGQSSFPAPAPAGPYTQAPSTVVRPNSLKMYGTFGLTDANGVWRLWVRDDNGTPRAPEVVVGAIAGGWGLEFLAPTAAGVDVSGRVSTADGHGVQKAMITLTDSHGVTRTALSTSLGYYRFEGVTTGETYIIGVQSKRYTFGERLIQVFDSLADVDLIAQE